MAVRAMRMKDVGYVRLALSALSLEDARKDYRETVADLAMLRHVTIGLNANWPIVCDEAADISSQDTAKLLRGFAARPPESVPLKAFLLTDAIDSNGPTIQHVSSSGA
jgi:hypothetical protein